MRFPLVLSKLAQGQQQLLGHRSLGRCFIRIVEPGPKITIGEEIQLILKAIKQLMAPLEKPTKRIGFQIREKRALYGKG